MGGSASKNKQTGNKDGEKEKNLSPHAAAAASASDTTADSSATKDAESTPDSFAAKDADITPDTSGLKEKEVLADTPPEKKTEGSLDTSATKGTSSDISAVEEIESLGTDTTWIKIADHTGENKLMELSPFDRNAAGRAVPMLWYYKDTLDQDVLLSSLRKALSAYPALSGRYASDAVPSMAAKLSNEGLPVLIEHTPSTIAEVVAHLPSSPDHISPCYFSTTACEKFLPRKYVGHIDAGSPDMPPLAIKVTYFKGAGAVIGILISHGFCDAESIMLFMQNWSRCYRGLDIQITPIHDRCIVLRMPIEDADSQPSGDYFAKQIDVVPRGSKWIPGFAPVMPKIMGKRACVIPCPGAELKAWKASACSQLPADCKFVSTDDVVSARVWQALVRVRCQQVGVALDSDEPTTVMRAMNIRKRTSPPLGAGYCGNGVFGVWTQLTVRECLSMTPGHIAARLRATLTSWTPDTISAFAHWLEGHHKEGSLTKTRFDRFALTFVVSSWGFKWEDVDFNSKPLCFDHGAFVPIVAVLTPRHNCDGVNVWVSGKEDDVSRFAEYLKA